MTARTPEQRAERSRRSRSLRARNHVRRLLAEREPAYAAWLEATLPDLIAGARDSAHVLRAAAWAQSDIDHLHEFEEDPAEPRFCLHCGTTSEGFWHDPRRAVAVNPKVRTASA